MSDAHHQTLARAVATLFRPLARILIRNGVAWATFAEWTRKVYVDVAFEDFPPDGRKQTISRVAALTGLFRREVKRLRELPPPGDGASAERYNRATRVISGWLNDPRFHDAEGRPAVLPPDGEGASFAALVRAYSGDIPVQAMRRVLVEAGSVAETPAGLRLVRHAYVPADDPREMIRILGTDAGELIGTIDHNLTAPPDGRLFQRKVSNAALSTEALPAFRRLSAERAQALLEELDAWLVRHEVPADAEPDAGRYVALGIYYTERPTPKEEEPS